MRLWHESLIKNLPRQQLLGQHRECAALRGNGWGKPHKTVNYVFEYDLEKLYVYHQRIMAEMISRGYKPSSEWLNPDYRGKNCVPYEYNAFKLMQYSKQDIVYTEHNKNYLMECIDNLCEKGVDVSKMKLIA